MSLEKSVIVRPHPGLLPQEKGNQGPIWENSNNSTTQYASVRNRSNAGVETVMHKLSETVRMLHPLLGERAGVRASFLHTNNCMEISGASR
jgi:hypothetical protein